MKLWTLLALSLLLLVSPAFAQPAPDTAFSPDRLARIDRLLQQYVDQNKIAGAVALVLHDGKPVFERAVGWSDKEAGRRMTGSTVFRIASQNQGDHQYRGIGACGGRQDWAE